MIQPVSAIYVTAWISDIVYNAKSGQVKALELSTHDENGDARVLGRMQLARQPLPENVRYHIDKCPENYINEPVLVCGTGFTKGLRLKRILFVEWKSFLRHSQCRFDFSPYRKAESEEE